MTHRMSNHRMPSNRSTSRRIVPFMLPALALAWACQPPQETEKEETPPRPVRITSVATGDVVQSVEVVGELEGFEEVRVYPQVSGERIRTLAVKEGDTVKAGALLATVSMDMLDSAATQARAALDAARANLVNLEDNLRRTRPLAEAGSVPVAQIETLESQLKAAQAQVRQLEAGATQASVQRDRGQIRSPISGVVMGLTAREGDLVSPQFPLLTVVRSDKLKAVLRVPERDFLKIERNMPVSLSPLARADVQVNATVTVLSPAVDRSTRTGLVEVHLDNRDGKLTAGSSIRAWVELSRRSGVLLVPAEAVLFSADTHHTGEATAFVADGDSARRRVVTVGARQEDRIEVSKGLAAGESVIVQGAHFLRDGYPIRILNAGNDGDRAPAKAPSAREEIAQ